MSVVGQRGAEARRPTLASVGATLLVKHGGTEVLVAGGEQILVQDIAHFTRVGHWRKRQNGRVTRRYLELGRFQRNHWTHFSPS